MTNDWTQGISGEHDVGVDLRLDNDINAPYRVIRDIRSEARACERQWMQGERDHVDVKLWQKLFSLTDQCLVEQSKDLELMAWHVEAAIRVAGVDGLIAALSMMQSCIDIFGDTLFPTVDNDDPEWRLQSLTTLSGEDRDGSLVLPLYQLSLSHDESLPIWQYLQANDEQKKAIVNQCSITYLQTQYQSVVALKTCWHQCVNRFDAVFLDQAPRTDRMTEAVERVRSHLYQILSSKGHQFDLSPDQNVHTHINDQLPISNEMHRGDRTRDSALSELKQIAAYFHQREPHSPVPYMLERIIAWANMPLPDLLAQMISNTSELQQVYSLTGIGATENQRGE